MRESKFHGSTLGLVGNLLLFWILCIIPIVGWAIGLSRLVKWVFGNMTIDGQCLEFHGLWPEVFLKWFWNLVPIVGVFIFCKKVVQWGVERTHLAGAR